MSQEKWNLDREPTKWERIYGSFFSLLVFVLTSTFLYYSSSQLIVGEGVSKQALLIFVVANLFFVGSTYLLWRVAFTRRQKPSQFAIATIGYVIGGLSCIFLVLVAVGLGNTPYLASIALTGLSGSAVILSKGKRRGRS
jgi:hypothetical protein